MKIKVPTFILEEDKESFWKVLYAEYNKSDYLLIKRLTTIWRM